MGEGIFPCIIARACAVVLGGEEEEEGRLLLVLLAPALGPVAQHYSFDLDAHVPVRAHRSTSPPVPKWSLVFRGVDESYSIAASAAAHKSLSNG